MFFCDPAQFYAYKMIVLISLCLENIFSKSFYDTLIKYKPLSLDILRDFIIFIKKARLHDINPEQSPE